ncbi:putative membrane protein YvbJ [Neobacillus niacini]|uniref:zinc ribbon domain-containing protein n=1 Tax=Neobacillus niacini TaxID=86668 RepID=UPI00278722A2|nr:zinc ribbon domain-containing protein [Neobacillus niacini]MDQ1004919.1 putative membrane protein YvbJ [Neobacillus niacini]
MFCRKCGRELHETDQFCSHCGTQLNPSISVVTDPNIKSDMPHLQREKEKYYWPFLLPFVVLLLGSGSVLAIYHYETQQNEKAASYVKNAQTYALDGQWEKAVKKYDHALKIRPLGNCRFRKKKNW